MRALIGFVGGVMFSALPILHFVGEGLAKGMNHSFLSAGEQCVHQLGRISRHAQTDMLLLVFSLLFLIGGLFFERRSVPRVAKTNIGFIFLGLSKTVAVVLSVLWGLVSAVVLILLGIEYGSIPRCVL